MEKALQLSSFFAFALAQKALHLPAFSKFFSTIFLYRLTKFFIEILDSFSVAHITRISQIPLGKRTLNLKRNLFFLSSVNRYSWQSRPQYTDENFSAWYKRGGKHCWKRWESPVQYLPVQLAAFEDFSPCGELIQI